MAGVVGFCLGLFVGGVLGIVCIVILKEGKDDEH